ncbi:chitinase-like protein PB1E7.04c [Sinocyclocheilus grahami]|uniref:chitinase-like protein PB1E7.04c n=1 Tax=Sinocyclocheilus grahami TaxID=75366 RepID=UPI0007AC72BC|nr:PREDICTED: chitinase-like protein PB1E7.04c [Sinocyclocheilus grahami]
MEYTFQDGDAIQPISFLNELHLPTTTTVHPETTTGFSVTPSNLIPGSAVVTSKLVFSSSSPVPSEALVLSAINTLRNSRESQLSESVQVLNVTYEKITATSYAVIFKFNLSNLSMSKDPELRNGTYLQAQGVANNALNTLLNDPGRTTLNPKSTNFISTSNQIDGRMEYTFQDGDAIQPISFLNELHLPTTTTVHPETTTGFSVTPSNLIPGSAVVTSKLVFSSSSPVPSEALVLSAINTLRNSRESQLSESVQVLNVTYEKITATSYAVIFKFNLSNLSMSKDPELRNGTYLQAQGVANNALNTLLNDPGRTTLNPKSTNFISTSNQIDGRMEYTFQDGDAIQPVSFLNELRLPTVVTTASTLTTTPQIVLGRALIFIRLVFVTLGPLPNPDKILEVANTLMKTRLTTKQDTTTQDLSDPVSFVNVTYTKINETAYALNFGFEISNITMTEKLELRNGTHLLIQDSINTLLGKILLSNSSAPVIKFQAADFTGNSTVIQAKVEYVFSPSDIKQPSIFVQELLQLAEADTLTTTSPPILSRRAIIRIRLEFITLGPRPSENSVLELVKSILAANVTTKLTARTVSVSEPVTLANVVYLAINDTAYALIFAYEISKVSLTELKWNETYQVIQKKINDLVIQILKDPSVNLLIPANFKDNLTVIEANVTHVFSQYGSNTGAGFLVSALFTAFTTPVPTTMNTTILNNSTNVAWIVAIIVPCAIVIGLVPCWILLCCLLCGCCAAIRRRWHRRRSYNVQYTTRNSLF